jgi:RNA helicase
MKMCNKWWDGYQGEKAVIIDDFDKSHEVLGHHLKIWGADYAPFVGESKGGALAPDYDTIIVTSNWSMEEIWTDSKTLEPLVRRFKEIYFE